MNINISGKNYVVDEKLQASIEKKLSKLGKYFSDDIDANVIISEFRGRDKVEVSINAKGAKFRTEQLADDANTGIDIAVDKLASQISKFKGKLQKKLKDNRSVRFEEIPEPVEEPAVEEAKVVRTKSLDLVPMSVEEAILEMEMIDHDFFVFINNESDLVNIVYKRKDGGYGILETKY